MSIKIEGFNPFTTQVIEKAAQMAKLEGIIIVPPGSEVGEGENKIVVGSFLGPEIVKQEMENGARKVVPVHNEPQILAHRLKQEVPLRVVDQGVNKSDFDL